MAAIVRTFLMAMLFLSAVYMVATAMVATGDSEVRGPDYVATKIGVESGEYTHCRDGCASGWASCKDRCNKLGYSNGGECVGPFEPQDQQCCCLGPLSA